MHQSMGSALQLTQARPSCTSGGGGQPREEIYNDVHFTHEAQRLSEAPKVSQPEAALLSLRSPPHASSQQATLSTHLCVTAFQTCGVTCGLWEKQGCPVGP